MGLNLQNKQFLVDFGHQIVENIETLDTIFVLLWLDEHNISWPELYWISVQSGGHPLFS